MSDNGWVQDSRPLGRLASVISMVALLVVSSCMKENNVGDDIAGDQVQGDKIDGDQVTIVSGCTIGEQICEQHQLQECVQVDDGILGMAVVMDCAPGTCVPNSIQACPLPQSRARCRLVTMLRRGRRERASPMETTES